jgi:hypothetical protein
MASGVTGVLAPPSLRLRSGQALTLLFKVEGTPICCQYIIPESLGRKAPSSGPDDEAEGTAGLRNQ